ncbi:hypothetical protein Hypma_000392 [Hypsizygus marmoreus]|uniref:DUF7330 domain-containing protein n=1 Tax=Hypsizygus marmoreus TaxID=39966 RepID=A0A369JAP5_HYPMA|nr:hypothetical protein Hypma_000392 [Hypsizygus marmoreus]
MRGINLQTFKKEKVRPNPTNYLTVSRASIKGAFRVNSELKIDPFLRHRRSSVSEGDSRKNLEFTAEKGSIIVDIFLDTITAFDRNGPTTALDLKILEEKGNRNFPLIAKIHTNDWDQRQRFHLTVSGLDGYHALHLPPLFCGPVNIDLVAAGNLDTRVSVSAGFMRNSRIIRDLPSLSAGRHERIYFVGELNKWEGDQVDVVVEKGKLRLQIVGERDRDGLRRLGWKLGL